MTNARHTPRVRSIGWLDMASRLLAKFPLDIYNPVYEKRTTKTICAKMDRGFFVDSSFMVFVFQLYGNCLGIVHSCVSN